MDGEHVVPLGEQLLILVILAIPVACISWTVTHEEVFREVHDWCAQRSKALPRLWQRKFFYLFTCEYCFSHYVAIAWLAITRYHLLYSDWRGYVVAGFSLVWVANVYMSAFNRLRLEIKHEGAEIAAVQQATDSNARNGAHTPSSTDTNARV